MPNYQEQNAKAEQMGSAIALGCIGLPALVLLVVFVIVAIVG